MTGTAIAGDAILVAAVVTIGLLELRRHRRRARRRERGQALVESALVFAIFLPLALVAAQVALLLAYHLAQQQTTGTLAAVAAENGPGAAFDAAVASEAARIGCEAPAVILATTALDVTVVSLRCTWRAPIYVDASWPVSTSASAYVAPSPNPTPTPEVIP